MASQTDQHVGKEGLFEKFKELGIEPLTVDHPEVNNQINFFRDSDTLDL